MNPSIQEVALALSSWLASAACQATLVVVGLLLLERIVRLSTLRAGLVALAMLKLATPPWIAWTPPATGEGVLARGFESSAIPPALALALPLAWALGSLIALIRLLAQRARLARALDRAVPCAEPGPLAALDRAAETLRLPRRPRLLLSAEASAPYTAGFLRPCIVLPQGWIEALSPQDMKSVLLHEAAHVRRNDPLRLELAAALGVLWWWNPAFWWANARWRACIEDACDDRVLDHSEADPHVYCVSLLRAARLVRAQGTDVFAGAAGMASSAMERRLRRLMAFRLPPSRRRTALAVVCLLLLGGIVIPYVSLVAFPGHSARHAVVHTWKHGVAHPHAHR